MGSNRRKRRNMSQKPYLHIFVVLLPLLCSMSIKVSAFQTSSLIVAVVDVQSAHVQSATVRLTSADKKINESVRNPSSSAIFRNIYPGQYTLEVVADGFKLFTKEVQIKAGESLLTINLEIAPVIEEVEIKSKPLDGVLEEAFSNFLTSEQLASLPEDPDDLERELRNRFGQDAVIRVDGFGGNRLPPKSQIASIRVVRSSFDAEYHKLGVTIIDVTTKSGVGNWNGSVFFNYNDASLNARNPLSLQKLPTQDRNFSLYVSGPLMKKKNSLFLSVFGKSLYNENNIVAVLPEGDFKGSVRSSATSISPWIKFSQNLSYGHLLGITYQGQITKSENVGAGGINLPTRAFRSRISNHILRVSENGGIGKHFYNEFRVQYSRRTARIDPNSNERTIVVLDSFIDGGASNESDLQNKSIWLADNLLFNIRKNHAVKVGGIFEYQTNDSSYSYNRNGTFTFSSLRDFTFGRPSQFTLRPEAREVDLSRFQFGAYIQDDIRLRKTFLLSLGLRYEWQNNLNDYNNFSPRLGFSWSLDKRGVTVIRGGAGIYYDWLETNDLATVVSRDFTQPSEIVASNPSFPEIVFSGFKQTLSPSFFRAADNLKNPYIFLTSLGLQRRLNTNTFLRFLYKYEKGAHLFRSRDINSPVNGVRPNDSFGRITQLESSGISIRNSLNVGLNGRLSKKLSYVVEYTLSKHISDFDGIFTLPSDSNDLQLDRSVSSTDQRHQLYLSSYFRIIRGLNLSVLFAAKSPLPYSVTTGFDDNKDTVFNDRPLGVSRNSERGEWQKELDASLSWTIGILKREPDESRFPGTIVLTSQEAKSGDSGISARHRFSLKFYATANNISNSKNFTQFLGTQSSPLFRRPIFANNPRRIELGIKFSF